VTPSRHLPPALLKHAAPRIALASLILALSVVGIVGSVVNARESQAFERRAVTTTATVLEGGTLHVPVQFEHDGVPVVADAPVVDREPYEPGEAVEVRFDPEEPTRVQLVEQPYDLATPLAFFVGLAAISAAAIAIVIWRARRLVVLAASPSTTFAFIGDLRHEDRSLRREQTWVILGALDRPDAPPVASVPLLPGQLLPQARPFQALVKGEVRDGGTAVVLAEEQVLWPSGRVRVDPARWS
jgi:hypothetical protein